MNLQKDLIRHIFPFYLCFAFYVIVGLTLHAYYEKEALHAFVNSLHHPSLDFIFKYLTHTGDLAIALPIALYLVYKKKWKFLIVFTVAIAFQGVVIQLIKRPAFIDHVRPELYMERLGHSLHLVEGVQQRITFTFPSGHTATVFTIGVFLCFLTPYRWIQLGIGLWCVLIAYSRVYLSQHFVLDTVAGSFIGVFSATLVFYVVPLILISNKNLEK